MDVEGTGDPPPVIHSHSSTYHKPIIKSSLTTVRDHHNNMMSRPSLITVSIATWAIFLAAPTLKTTVSAARSYSSSRAAAASASTSASPSLRRATASAPSEASAEATTSSLTRLCSAKYTHHRLLSMMDIGSNRIVGRKGCSIGNKAVLPSMARKLRGGGTQEGEGSKEGNVEITLDDVFSGLDAGKEENGHGIDNSNNAGGLSALFGKKKFTSIDATNDGAEDGTSNGHKTTGSLEITMNASPDGRKVDVSIETSPTLKDDLNQLVDPKQQKSQQGSIMAKLLSGGATSVASPNTTASTNNSINKNKSGQSILSSKFPITSSELPHFLSMSFLMFLFIYVFTTVRDTKDTLVVSNCGAEAIPFLKLYGVMPCAALFIVGYSKLSNSVGKQALFYATLVPFFVFYWVFAFVLFPRRDMIHFPLANSQAAGEAAGAASAAMNLLRYWSFSLYFIVSELWASAGVPLLFWQVSR